MDDQPSGPQMRALLETRRWLVMVLNLLIVGVATQAALRQWGTLSTWERAALAVAVAMAVAGAALGRRPAFLFLLTGAPAVLVLTALLAPHGAGPWIPMPNVATYTSTSLVLLPPGAGLVMVLVAPALVVAVWSQRPTNIVAGALELAGGWIVVAQVFVTVLAVWWAWRALCREAAEADRDFAAREGRAEDALVLQERARLWRQTAAGLHESLLNSLRYVMATPEPDRARLAVHAVAGPPAPTGGDVPVALTLDGLLAAVLEDSIAASVLRAPTSRPATTLSPAVCEALRSALVEAAHNAVRHGAATELRVEFATDPTGTLVVVASDDGIGMRADALPGIGLTRVLDESLRAVGGTATIRNGPQGGTEVVIRVPATHVGRSATLTRWYQPFDQGRFLLTAPVAGACAVGILYYLALGPLRALDRTGGSHYWLTIAFGVMSSVIAVALVLRRRRTSALVGLGLIVIPALVPWFLRTTDFTCVDSAAIAAAINISGFAMIVCAAWTAVVPGAVGVLLWASGGLIVVMGAPETCRQGLVLALVNSLLVLPVALVITYAGVRASQRAAERVDAVRRSELREQARAAAAADLNAGLSNAVEEGVALLAAIAEGAVLDTAMRARLESVDARIRAGVQVDALVAGGFAAAASRAVSAASAAGATVSVRALGGSSDARPLPLELEELVRGLLVGGDGSVIQVFTDGSVDYLSVVVDTSSVRYVGLAPGSTLRRGEVELQVFDEEREVADEPAAEPEPGGPAPSARCSVRISRPVEIPGAAVIP